MGKIKITLLPALTLLISFILAFIGFNLNCFGECDLSLNFYFILASLVVFIIFIVELVYVFVKRRKK